MDDLADITYIPLKQNPNFLLSGQYLNDGRTIQIVGNKIYIMDNSVLYVFDEQGNPVRKIDRRGKGPGEYVYTSYFLVDEANSEIFIHDLYEDEMVVCDLSGQLKRVFKTAGNQFISLNDSLILSSTFPMVPVRYIVSSKKDGRIVKEFDTGNDKNMAFDPEGMLQYATVYPTAGGAILADLTMKTKYRIDGKTLEMEPFLKENSDYPQNEISLHPSVETDDYQLFHILYSVFISPDMTPESYLYDKKENRFYKIPIPKIDEIALVKGDCIIPNRYLTQDKNIAARMLSPLKILKMKEQKELPPDHPLIAIADSISEEDNPVVMIMRFK